MFQKRFALLFAGLIVLSFGALFVLPVLDDWHYLSSPQFGFVPEDFLPGAVFWRPIDALVGLINGRCLPLFPYLNHVLVLCAYFYAWWQLKILLQRYSRGYAVFGALALFTVSPALVACVYSVDSVNQAFSLAFGVASLVQFGRRRWLAYLLMLLSLFSKENGIVWFGLTPVLSLLVLESPEEERFDWRGAICKLWKPALVSALLVIVYFVARFSLRESSPAPTDSGWYNSGLGWNSLKGLGILLAGALTCIDTLALFVERNWVVVVITAVVSGFFLLALLKGFLPARRSAKTWILWLSILLSCVPYILMDHPGEMHAYTIVWMLSLSIGLLFPAEPERWQRVAIGLFLLVCIPIYVHKAYYIIEQGRHAWARTQNAVQSTSFTPRKVVVLDCNPPRTVYSVFQTTSKNLWVGGLSTNLYFDGVNPQESDYRLVLPAEVERATRAVCANPRGADCLWILRGDEVECIDLRGKRPDGLHTDDMKTNNQTALLR